MAILSEHELAEALERLAQWRVDDGGLRREWIFKDFLEAMVFVNRVAELAEAADHHPDMDIRYNRVSLRLISHDVGGITKRDLRLAERIG